MAKIDVLPPELWSMIFRIATDVPGLLDTSPPDPLSVDARSWNAEFDNIDRSTKRALVVVCKAWRKLALVYLFEHLVIVRKRRLHQLAITLNSGHSSVATPFHDSSSGVGRYVKRIDLRIQLDNNWTKHYTQNLTLICELCPNLRIFHQHKYPGHFYPVVTPRVVHEALMGECAGEDTRHTPLIRDFQIWPSSIPSLEKTMRSLQTFGTIQVLLFRCELQGCSSLDPVSLPQLHTLELLHWTSHPILIWAASWDIPNLARLRIEAEELRGGLNEFLERHGPNIKDLDLKINRHFSAIGYIAKCPSLIAATAYATDSNLSQLSHQTLKLLRLSMSSRHLDAMSSWISRNTEFILTNVMYHNSDMCNVIPRLSTVRFVDIRPHVAANLHSILLTRKCRPWFEYLDSKSVKIEDSDGKILPLSPKMEGMGAATINEA
jgi:hypothetical protein